MYNLLQNQDILQKRAFEVIEKLHLEKLLSKYGEFKLVGSIVYGLMTWKDIDANLNIDEDPRDEVLWEIVHRLFVSPEVKKITIADNRRQTEKNRPKSIYIGIKHMDEIGDIWKIDLRLIARDQISTDAITKLLHEKMTDEYRKVILEIKSKVYDNPRYHRNFSSVDIYEAVLLTKVRNLSGFEKYLHEQGKNL